MTSVDSEMKQAKYAVKLVVANESQIKRVRVELVMVH